MTNQAESSSRTLYDILLDAKEGASPTYDECYYALLVLDALATFDSKALRELAHRPENAVNSPRHQSNRSFERWKGAVDKPPLEWLGPNNDPRRVSDRVKTSRAIFNKLSAKLKNTLDVDGKEAP